MAHGLFAVWIIHAIGRFFALVCAFAEEIAR